MRSGRLAAYGRLAEDELARWLVRFQRLGWRRRVGGVGWVAFSKGGPGVVAGSWEGWPEGCLFY